MRVIKPFLPIAAAALFWVSYSASAQTALTLVDVLEDEEIQQTGDDPCVIGDSSCTNNQPAGMDWTVITTPSGEWDLTSPTYTIGQLEAALGTGGSIVGVGIDVNITGTSTETLDYFEVWIDGSLEYYYNTNDNGAEGDPDLADAVDLANGTGFSDWLLLSFDLSLYDDTDEIYFVAGMDGTGDGKEQFFLTNDLAPIPLPAAVWLMGSALLLLTGIGRRASRRNRLATTA
ncbi:MAG: VPLPA-CTERM sorting domain-containing protein [Gammaproteobacteria bacterium]|nr:VPLPA-CTERM sorting domain-containing protein [Gammaproteobacteria bacterium]MDH3464612.1 VPLPA-CTERM sorting domain-containing protein [Gammaproteobacteria bacterium]